MAEPWKRYEGRQALGRLMHGENVLVGSPDVWLTTTTFGVAAVKQFPDQYFKDWFGRFYDGPQANKDFQVTDFDQETEPGLLAAVFTISPAMAAAVITRDLFEMYQDYSPKEMNDALNLAIDMVAGEALEDKRDESLTLVDNTFEYSMPPGFSYLEQIFVESSTAGRYSVATDLVDIRHWSVLVGSPPRLWFDDAYFSITAGRKLRLVGQTRPTRLNTDSDVSNVDQAYVLYQAKANLHFARSEQSGDAHQEKMGLAQTLADRERFRLMVAGRGLKVAF